MNVILYCRVSTDEQREYGASISFQQDTLNDYCIRRDYTVVGCYIEDYSAKHHDMKRPGTGLQEVLSSPLNISESSMRWVLQSTP